MSSSADTPSATGASATGAVVTGGEDAADEVVQDVWLRILRGLPGLREPARLRPWIFGIARRVLMDRLRAQYAAPPLADVDVADLVEHDDPGAASENLDQLHAAFAHGDSGVHAVDPP